MNVLILFWSQKGFIAEAAERLKGQMRVDTVLCDLKRSKEKPASYDTVVLCGAVHAGKLPGKLLSYMKKHEADLKGKKTAFLLGGMDQKNYKDVFKKNMPPSLADMSLFYLGGRFIPEDHNFIIRKIMSKISGQEGALHNEHWEGIDELVRSLEKG